MSCQQVSPYYSEDSDVYHDCKNCTLGDNIESDKLERGNPGRRRLCQRCKDIKAGRVTR
jgi:hypothetical protein